MIFTATSRGMRGHDRPKGMKCSGGLFMGDRPDMSIVIDTWMGRAGVVTR